MNGQLGYCMFESQKDGNAGVLRLIAGLFGHMAVLPQSFHTNSTVFSLPVEVNVDSKLGFSVL